MITEIIRCSNSSVTDFYLDIIQSACDKVSSKGKATIVAQFQDFIPNKIKKKRIIYWVQGAVAEEYHMRHRNRLKEFAINLCEKYSLKKADFILFVSDRMKRHFEEKYHLHFDESRYYVMPCFNTQLNHASFESPIKYKQNIFTYIGSLEVWQGFDHILDCYKQIEELALPNTKLLVLTSDQEKAKQKIEERSILQYEISYCDNKDLPLLLKDVKYGFILRENNLVNNVATPTKISTYMANGIIPIYSKSLDSFHQLSKGLKYVVEEGDLIDKIKNFHESVTNEEIRKEYEGVFESYYSEKYHIEKLFGKLQQIFK